MSDLVLSLFPGIGIMDQAFEDEGFCVVRGPDLLWGGNIKKFHAPRDRFDGVIGGPPCQRFSLLANLVLKVHGRLAEDLIPEFERIVEEAQPAWFLMENVQRAPVPRIAGYQIHAPLFDNRWIGGEQSRRHRFSFGTRDGRKFITTPWETAFEAYAWSPRVLAAGGSPKLDRDHKPKRGNSQISQRYFYKDTKYFREAVRLQGLASDFDLPGFTVKSQDSRTGKCGAVSDGGCPRSSSQESTFRWRNADEHQRMSELNRNAELAVIHIAKKELALDDDLYREIVRRVSARFRRNPVNSSGDMTARERGAMLTELHTLGFRNPTAPRKAPAPGSFQEAKIRELWRLLNEAGALNDSSEKALQKFIRRQTMGAQTIPRWLTAEQANKVIEGLKSWHARIESRRESETP